MSSNWNRWEGVFLGGRYGLQEYLGESGKAAFFRATFGQERQPALLKLIQAQDPASEQQLEIWRKVARISHPNLLRLLDCGQAQTGAGSVLYAAFEYPDETLAGAGPLTEQEARDVIASAIDALRYIHSQGFVHTAIDRDHILAVGNQIKLSSDTIREASGAAAPTEDARSLAQLASQL